MREKSEVTNLLIRLFKIQMTLKTSLYTYHQRKPPYFPRDLALP